MRKKWIYTACLIVLSLALVGLGLVQLLWADAPDAVVRGLGVLALIALPVFAFVTVRRARQDK